MTAKSSEVKSRQGQADAVVNKYVPWAMGVGFVPSPLLIVAGLTGIQLKMLADLSKVYGIEFTQNRAKSVVAALLGGVIPAGIGGTIGGLVASIPFVGVWLLPATMPLLGGAATFAIGKTFVQHFESGGTFLDFDALGAKQLFAERFEEGKAHAKKVVSKVDAKLSSVVDI